MIAFLLVILLIVAIITLGVLARRQAKKQEEQRTEALRSLAVELGWEFYPSASARSEGMERLALTELTSVNEIKNMMYGEVDGVPTTVFDYIYTLGSAGKHPTVWSQTVVLLEPEDQEFPEFTLRPEDVFDKMFSAFGYQDVDFGQRPGFSRQYIVRGADEAAIRELFSDEVISFYESNPGTHTDGGENQLFVYRSQQRLLPEEIKPAIESSLDLLDLMQNAEPEEEDSENAEGDNV